MKNVSKILSVIALCVTVSFVGCKDENEPSGPCGNSSLTMNIDGVAFTAKSFNSTLMESSIGGTDGKRMDIRATNADGVELTITLFDLSAGSSGDGVSADAEYFHMEEVENETDNVYFFTIKDGDVTYESFNEGSLDITGCDAEAKTVSGTFSYSSEDIEVTNGRFTDVCYTIR